MRIAGCGLSCVLLIAALPAFAQTQDSGDSSKTGAKPAAPVDTAQANPPAASTEKKKPKKIWTNDEIGSVKGSVSVVGEAKRSKTNRSSGQADDYDDSNEQHQQMVENYRNQIEELNSRIEAIDNRIAQLKNFKAENTSPSGGITINKGYNMVPLEEQVKQLEEKKKQLRAAIDDLENEARKNGVDPGELR